MTKETKSRNRSALIVLSIILAVASVAGLTYSWFTTSIDNGSRSITMGRLQVESTFDTDDTTAVYEPGLEITKEGSLKNTGSIPSFVKISVNPTVQKYSDADGNAIAPGDPIVNDPNVTCEFDPDKLGYSISGVDGADSYFWYKDSDGNYYVLMDGAANAEVALNIGFDGANMGNDYQGAEISFDSEWKATQALPAAILAEFNVDFYELEFIGNDLNATGTLSSRSNSAALAESMARAILERAQ